ncbi:MAG: DUF167 domain-containing protein [Gemmataceae bacterium]
MSVVVQPHASGATIAVRAQPGAKKSAVVGEWNGMLKIAVTAPPEDGRANDAIGEVLKKLLGVRRSEVELISGKTNRNKVFLIHHSTVEMIQSKLPTL